MVVNMSWAKKNYSGKKFIKLVIAKLLSVFGWLITNSATVKGQMLYDLHWRFSSINDLLSRVEKSKGRVR